MRHKRGLFIVLWTLFLVYYVSGWGCSDDNDCFNVEQCVSGECENPCVNHTCGKNQHCSIVNLEPACIYLPGNTENSTAEYVGLPLVGPECTSHDHCPSELACIRWKCVDPCLDACGENTVCQSKHHISACACKPGFFGNPFEGCKRDQGTGSGGSFPQFSGKKKKFQVESAFRVNWSTGFYNCLNTGRRLATIESKVENDLAKKEIKKTKIRNARFWTSGTDLAFGTWTWATTGQPFGEFSDWNPNEPNNGGACMQFEERFYNGYGWTDQGCYGDNYHICEYYE